MPEQAVTEQKPAQQQEPMTVVDDAAVKEIYANKLIATTFDGGALSITVGATRVVPEKIAREANAQRQADVHVTARLALSPAAAMELTNALTKMLNTLTKIAASRMDVKAPGAAETQDAS